MTCVSNFQAQYWTYPTKEAGNNCAVSKSSTAILAERLTKLIEDSKLSVNAWAKSKRLNVRQTARMAKGLHATKLDTLDSVAKQLRMQPWELITPVAEVGTPTGIQDGDLDFLLLGIKDRKDRITAYLLAAQVITAIEAGLVVQPICTLDPAEETPLSESRADAPARKRSATKSSTDPA